jgi:hypothetical protein
MEEMEKEKPSVKRAFPFLEAPKKRASARPIPVSRYLEPAPFAGKLWKTYFFFFLPAFFFISALSLGLDFAAFETVFFTGILIPSSPS